MSDVDWSCLVKCDLFRFRLHIFLWSIASFHFSLLNRIMMRDYKCCVFIFLFQSHFSWLLILMRSHLSMKMLHFTCLCLVVCLYRNILLFFPLNCMLNEIYFCLNYRGRFSAFCWLLLCRKWATSSALDLLVSLLLKHVFEVHLDDIASSSWFLRYVEHARRDIAINFFFFFFYFFIKCIQSKRLWHCLNLHRRFLF